MGNVTDFELYSSSEEDGNTDDEEVHCAMFEVMQKYNINPNNHRKVPSNESISDIGRKSYQMIETLIKDKSRPSAKHTDTALDEKKVKLSSFKILCDPTYIFSLNNLEIDTNIDYYYNSESEQDSEYEWDQIHGRSTERIENNIWLQACDSFTNKRNILQNKWRRNEWNRIYVQRKNQESKSHPNCLNRMYELEIYFIGIHPRIYRQIQIQSYLSLAIIHDKIFCPLFGFKRNFHAYQFRKKHYKYKRISYGPRYADSVDMMHIHPILGIKKIGSCMLESQFIRLNDLLVNIGDEIRYDYDLGQSYSVNIRLTNIHKIKVSDIENVKLVTIINGKRAGPPENMEGNRGWVERLNIVTKYEYDALIIKNNNNKLINAIHEIINAPNLIHRKKVFDPEIFNKQQCIKKIRKCFGSILSKQSARYQLHPINCTKRDEAYKFQYKQLHFTPRICHNPKCRKLNGDIKNRSEASMKMDKKFKSCSRCLSAFYCNKRCQKIHWNIEHRVYCFHHLSV